MVLAGEPITITEIMYRASSENDLEEYIEIYNGGTVATNLQGWKLTAGVDYTFDNVSLGAAAYLVVAADVSTFQAKYPGVTNVVGGWSGQLSNSGETITLRDAANTVVDKVEYADEGDWGVRERGMLDRGHQGWVWTSLADGKGRSLELVSASMPHASGQNWSASITTQGTPGAANSVQATNIAPLVLDVKHSPAIPGSTDEVTVTATLVDELTINIEPTLHWRIDGQPTFATATMFDDGQHGDGAANDGVFGAKLPPAPNYAVVEFYVSASDGASNTRTWPAQASPALGQVTNALFQVDDSYDPNLPWIPGSQPIYRVIMTEAERAELAQIGSASSQADSDAQMNATFISQDGTDIRIRYNVGVRNRGNGTRDNPPNNYRINFVSDRKWNDATALDINSKYTFLQATGNAVFAMAGLPTSDAALVQVRVNGQNLAEPGTRMYGSYVESEVYNSEWAAAHFPDDASGNLYKIKDEGHDADLTYLGANPQAYIDGGYSKQTNVVDNDWSDLIHLTDVLTNAPAETFVQQVEQVVNVDQWLRWFAVHTLLGNQETNLSNGEGDDYSLYRGVSDPRFILLPHDLDTVFGLGDSPPDINESIFLAASQLPIGRLLNNPAFTGRYYAILQELIATTLSPTQIDPLIDQVAGAYLPVSLRDQMKQFVVDRSAAVLAQIPEGFTVNSGLPVVSGFPRTTSDVAALQGTADPVVTGSVVVGGELASFVPKTGTWSIGTTNGGGGNGPQTLVATGSTWKYLADGTSQGTSWREASFVDAGWLQGPAKLGYGGDGEVTNVGFVDTVPGGSVQKNITTYFRHAFTVADPTQFVDLTLRVLRDDGVSVFLNGVEVARDNLPGTLGDGSIAYTTPAQSTVSGSAENQFFEFTVSAAQLNAGLNVFAVEIHQENNASSDIGFDLELIGNTPSDGDALTGVPLNPGINRLFVQTFSGPGGSGELLEESWRDVWYDDGDMSNLSGTLTASLMLDAASGPWHITGDIIIPAGITLTIEPGTTLFFDAGAGLTVNGRLLAEGTSLERIRLTRTPGAIGKWDGLRFANTDEDNRLAYVDHDFGDNQGDSIQVSNSRLTIDHAWWGGTTITVIEMSNPKVILQQSVLPSIINNETLHGSGLTNDSFLVLDGNIFGTTTGYSDVIDFTGGQRPGPILQIYNNIFLGGSDDGLDLDGTDAHIEGNVFMNFIQDAPRDSSANAIATGKNGSDVSHLVVVRNYFFNNDHDILLKEQSSAIVQQNTFVGSTIASVHFDEPERSGVVPGAGADFDGNIFWNVNRLFDYLVSQNGEPDPVVTIKNSIVPAEFHSLGTGNLDIDPRLVFAGLGRFTLEPGSPALGAGVWDRDIGANVPAGPWIFGEPTALTRETSATLSIGGPGIIEYRYRVNGGAWSADTPVSIPVMLTGLADGPYAVEVVGCNSAGVWQADAEAVASQTWTVQATLPRLLINEVLASNNTAVSQGGAFPDLVELYNAGATTINLAGLSITDNPASPMKYVFPAGTTLPAGEYLVLNADDSNPAPGIHLGFSLNGEGEGVWLFDRVANGGALLDSIQFGSQAADWSIGRVGHDEAWALTVPSFGTVNVAAQLGDPARLKINEIFADGRVRFDNDYVELYNADIFPVALGGLYLSDDPGARPDLHQIAPLSFISPGGYSAFVADDDISKPNHVAFKLDARQEIVALFDARLREIDRWLFYGQTTDYSQGRFPDGSNTLAFFRLPTRGVANAVTETPVVNLLIGWNDSWRYNQSNINLETAWRATSYVDTAWPQGTGIFAQESGALPANIGTTLTIGPPTYYFRRHFHYTPAAAGVSSYLKLTTLLDDGAVVYINGQEFARVGMSNGSINFGTFANRSVEAAFEGPLYIPLSLLNAGDNVIAVEVHQSSAGSTDVVFGLSLEQVANVSNGVYANEMAILDGLRITELDYNPASGSQSHEFIELRNDGGVPLDLNGVRITDGVEFTFPALTLQPGEYTVVVKDFGAFTARYGSGINVAGVYTGSLNNGGETIVVALPIPLDAAAIRLEYDATYGLGTVPSPGGSPQEILARTTVFADTPGAWISELTLTDPDAYTLTFNDPRFIAVDGHLYLPPTVQLNHVTEPTISLHVTATNTASPGLTISGTYTLTVLPRPASWDHAHQWAPLVYDVNADGLVTPLDALLIIVEINALGPHGLTDLPSGTAPPLFLDVSGDDFLNPLDAVLVVNFLNAGGVGEGEAELPEGPPRAYDFAHFWPGKWVLGEVGSDDEDSFERLVERLALAS